MSHYDFDAPVDRRGTDSLKFDRAEEQHHSPDLLSLWVADMDFRAPDEVLDAIETDEHRYLALLPVHSDPKDILDDNGELVIVRVAEEDGEEFFEEIEDDDEYETVADAFIDRLQDVFEIDEQ
jgi:hypothetical protein